MSVSKAKTHERINKLIQQLLTLTNRNGLVSHTMDVDGTTMTLMMGPAAALHVQVVFSAAKEGEVQP